jgi:hypothetical protein
MLENIKELEMKMLYTNEIAEGERETVAAVVNVVTGKLEGLRLWNYSKNSVVSFIRYISFAEISMLSEILKDLSALVSGGNKSLVEFCLSIVNNMVDCRPGVEPMISNQTG